MKLFLTFTLTFLVLFSACDSSNEIASEPINPTVSNAEIIKKADELFSQRSNIEKLKESIFTIARARNIAKRDFEVEWKFAKYNYFLSKQITDKKEIDKLLEDGYEAGIIAIKLEPNKPDGYFWAGACLGEQARKNPLTMGIKSTDEIRQLMNKVIEIQPDYQKASAFDALAQLELATRLVGGTPQKAIEYLEKALEYDKENGYIYLHLGEAYLASNKNSEAKKQLDFVLKMNPIPEYQTEHLEITEKARKILETKF